MKRPGVRQSRQVDTRPSGNPKPPEHINNSYEHPLKDFLILSAAVLLLISALTWLLAASASWIAPQVPYQWEVDYLQQNRAVEQVTEKSESSQQTQRVLTQLLHKVIGTDALPTQLHYLENEETPNAFATVGGHIFVTQGLLKNIKSENGLAMVLAHEYAHIQLRHPLTLMMEQLSIGLVLTLMGGDNIAQMVTQNTSMFTVLAFSREMERASDAFALQRLSATYGHTRGADEFFTQMQTLESEQPLATESKWLEFLQTHPLTGERVAYLQREMSEGTVTPLPTSLQQEQNAGK